MALTNMGFNDKFGLILEDQNRRERERKRKRRRREERKKERSSSKIKGMETKFKYGTLDFCMELCIDCMDTCLWVVGCEKPNPKMSCCMAIIINPFVFLGFCYEKI